VLFYPALPLGNGIQDFSYPMANIVPDNVFYKQTGKQNPNHRINQVKIIRPGYMRIAREEMLYQVNGFFQQNSAESRTDAYDKTQYQDKIPFPDMPFPP
jgi:hypothetical protein